MSQRLATAFFAAGLVVLAGFVLARGASLVVPVVEALAVWFVLNAMADAACRLPGLGHRLSRGGALALSALAVLALGALVVATIAGTAADLGARAASLPEALGALGDRVATRFGLSRDALAAKTAEGIGLESAVRAVVAATAATIAQGGLVAVYVGFLLVDQQFFPAKLRALVPDPLRRARVEAHFERIQRSIKSYLWVMTQVSLLTAVLSYAVMRVVGMEQATFWATAIFFLNFIPTVGSILGTVLPVAFALLQFQAPLPVLAVLLGIGTVQVVIGNVILPKMAGTSLNISLFVTIFSLFFWGALWGVTGMFVALPLTAMIILTLGSFDATRPLAILMSRTGEVEPTHSAG